MDWIFVLFVVFVLMKNVWIEIANLILYWYKKSFKNESYLKIIKSKELAENQLLPSQHLAN